ncbi:radical SAM protein [bacterium]|nr:radical SAM protein [bacterium]
MQQIEKPEILASFSRIFYRYGIAVPDFEKQLNELKKTKIPDAFLITSQMTYWYPGIRFTADIIREHFHGTPIVLGGIYPTLCPEHAIENFQDCTVIPGQFDQNCLDQIDDLTGYNSNFKVPTTLDDSPYPAYELYPQLDSIALLTSRGCPYNCGICASKILQPNFEQRNINHIIDELETYKENYGVTNFAIYDDALLSNPGKHIIPLLERVIKADFKVNFHVPNGLQVSDITHEVAQRLRKAGFKEIRLSFEGFGTERVFKKPVSEKAFTGAVEALRKAGFRKNQLRAYIITGLPRQDIDMLFDSILLTHRLGVRIELAYLSLIPGTPGFDEYREFMSYPIDREPLLHNNTLWNWRFDEPFKWEKKLRELVRYLNSNQREGNIITSNNNIVKDLIQGGKNA